MNAGPRNGWVPTESPGLIRPAFLIPPMVKTGWSAVASSSSPVLVLILTSRSSFLDILKATVDGFDIPELKQTT